MIQALENGDQHVTGYAHVANQLLEWVSYRSLTVLINGWEDVAPRVAYRTSTDRTESGPRWTVNELHSFVEYSGADESTSGTVVERAKALWAIVPIGDLKPSVAYLLVERDPEVKFTEKNLWDVRSAAMMMATTIVEAELRSSREMLVLEHKLNRDMSERVIEASESRGWQESAHQELQRAFDNLSEQKLELEEAYRWSTVAQGEIQQAFDDLKVANGAKTRFLATVSHELKTPLTSISAFTDILKKNRSGKLQPRELRQLDVIGRNVRRLNLLINDLLDLTRIDAGTLALEPGEFHVSDLLGDMAAMFDPILNRRSQTLELEDGSGDKWLRGDRDRLEQMVTNLVTNASKFSSEGATIRLSATVSEDRLELNVADRGVGIPSEALEQIFEAFYRVDNEETRGVPGTGVGLYITSSIVRLHGGEITVNSKFGQGTTFRAVLPGVIDGPSDEHLKREATRLEALDDHRSRLQNEAREAA